MLTDAPFVLIARHPQATARDVVRAIPAQTREGAHAMARALHGWAVTVCDCRDETPPEERVRRVR